MADSITLEEARRRCAEALREYQETKAAWDAAEEVSRAHSKEKSRLQDVAREAYNKVQNALFINTTLGELTPQQYSMLANEALLKASEALNAHVDAAPPYRAIRINDAQSKYEALAWLVLTLEKL